MIKVSSLVGVAVFILITAGCSSTSETKESASEGSAVLSDNTTDKAGVSAAALPAVAAPAQTASEKTTPTVTKPEKKFDDPYELSRFMGDFKQYHAGDIVPELYRSNEYNIGKWQQRNLPAPGDGNHWTYFGGTYVLITDAKGKILRMFEGDIIYKQP